MQNRPGGPRGYGGGPRGPRPTGGYGDVPEPLSHIRSKEYLAGGYLDAKGNTRVEIVTSDAQKVAQELQGGRLNYGQLRIFFSKIRHVEDRLRSNIPFDDLKADIACLKPAAAYAITREVAPPVFQDFMDHNVSLSLQSEANFRKGFFRHFESIVCFFPRPRGQ